MSTVPTTTDLILPTTGEQLDVDHLAARLPDMSPGDRVVLLEHLDRMGRLVRRAQAILVEDVRQMVATSELHHGETVDGVEVRTESAGWDHAQALNLIGQAEEAGLLPTGFTTGATRVKETREIDARKAATVVRMLRDGGHPERAVELDSARRPSRIKVRRTDEDAA